MTNRLKHWLVSCCGIIIRRRVRTEECEAVRVAGVINYLTPTEYWTEISPIVEN